MKETFIKLKYDPVADAACLYLYNIHKQNVFTDSFEIKEILEFGTINLDFDENKLLLRIEILNASKHIQKELLDSAKDDTN